MSNLRTLIVMGAIVGTQQETEDTDKEFQKSPKIPRRLVGWQVFDSAMEYFCKLLPWFLGDHGDSRIMHMRTACIIPAGTDQEEHGKQDPLQVLANACTSKGENSES